MDVFDGGNRLFVYGTLRSEFDNPHARRLREGARLLGPAWVEGSILHLGRYPGFRRGRGGRVIGEVYELGDPVALLASLDAYEGDEYRRIAIDVAGFGAAWIYELAAVPAGACRIESGDFLNA